MNLPTSVQQPHLYTAVGYEENRSYKAVDKYRYNSYMAKQLSPAIYS